VSNLEVLADGVVSGGSICRAVIVETSSLLLLGVLMIAWYVRSNFVLSFCSNCFRSLMVAPSGSRDVGDWIEGVWLCSGSRDFMDAFSWSLDFTDGVGRCVGSCKGSEVGAGVE